MDSLTWLAVDDESNRATRPIILLTLAASLGSRIPKGDKIVISEELIY